MATETISCVSPGIHPPTKRRVDRTRRSAYMSRRERERLQRPANLRGSRNTLRRENKDRSALCVRCRTPTPVAPRLFARRPKRSTRCRLRLERFRSDTVSSPVSFSWLRKILSVGRARSSVGHRGSRLRSCFVGVAVRAFGVTDELRGGRHIFRWPPDDATMRSSAVSEISVLRTG